ncbi:MAG: hypothetical protein IH606_12830 [Burkholderiales bacterium]|nr:hypothetical protein [Burkholderiales bacterium]
MKHAPKDPRGGHARLYWTLLDSPAYLALSYSAKALYVDLRRRLLSTNNGNINAALSTLKHRGWRSSATLNKALIDLVAVGLIAQTRQGGIASMSKICSLYRFTDEEVFDHPKLGIPKMKATHDYRRFDKLAWARAAVREARQSHQGKNRKVQKLKLTASEPKAMRPFIASETEQGTRSQFQKVNQ